MVDQKLNSILPLAAFEPLLMSFRLALFPVLGVFVVLFSRVLFRGEIICRHDYAREVGSPEGFPARLPNRKFFDESSAVIPELANILGTNHLACLSTWKPSVELGRPPFRLSGLSRTSALTQLLYAFTANPFILCSTLVLLAIGLTTLFALLFFRAFGLHPAAGALSSLGLGLTTVTMRAALRRRRRLCSLASNTIVPRGRPPTAANCHG